MIKPLTITDAIRQSVSQPCPLCGAERLILKQWVTRDEYRAHQAGGEVAYHHSLSCNKCGWDERALAPEQPTKQAPQEGKEAEWDAMRKGGTKL